jgi:hypothetical protein
MFSEKLRTMPEKVGPEISRMISSASRARSERIFPCLAASPAPVGASSDSAMAAGYTRSRDRMFATRLKP